MLYAEMSAAQILCAVIATKKQNKWLVFFNTF